VIILGLDTATPSTAVAIARPDGWVREAREDRPEGGGRPAHAARVLALAAELLETAGAGWEQVGRVAVGVGPGGYTGLRIGLATARGIALAGAADLTGVSTLRALAEPLGDRPAVALLDARRGEAFVAVYAGEREILAPCVCRPHELVELARRGGPDALAVGDGALRFREILERAAIDVAPAHSEAHHVSAGAICRLAIRRMTTAAAPEYLRLADAEIARGGGTR